MGPRLVSPLLLPDLVSVVFFLYSGPAVLTQLLFPGQWSVHQDLPFWKAMQRSQSLGLLGPLTLLNHASCTYSGAVQIHVPSSSLQGPSPSTSSGPVQAQGLGYVLAVVNRSIRCPCPQSSRAWILDHIYPPISEDG